VTKIVVHTGAGPNVTCAEEERILPQVGIEFIKRGPCPTPEQVIEAIPDADVAMCWNEPYTREVFAQNPRLKAVLRAGVGVDTVDLEAATEHGVMVGYFPDFCIPEVANHSLALMLDCAKKVSRQDRVIRREGWGASRTFRSPMGPIHGETLGLVAFGNIAQAMAVRGQCLAMNVIAYDPYLDAEVFEAAGVKQVSLEELAEQSDYVSCHLPLNAGTQGMLDASFFGRMKPTAYFVNTGRGPVVNEPDLIAALQDGKIAGAGLDVFEQEPLPAGHPFLEMDNVVMTSHSASYSDETMRVRDVRMAEAAITILEGGVPEFVANRAVLERRRT
jgi:D-3-phosphoglycerate dehydrogenase / 2-oxoglutarate reductase